MVSKYQFLVETYETEILKVLGVWSEFADQDLTLRPRPDDPRGRNQLEHMVHQSVSENLWFQGMLGISVTENPLPSEETRTGFIRHYAGNAGKRLQGLRSKPDSWWEEEEKSVLAGSRRQALHGTAGLNGASAISDACCGLLLFPGPGTATGPLART